MIETIVLDYLGGKLTEPVYMEAPPEPPRTYVVIEKTGSGAQNGLCSATLAVQSVAPTLYGAASLNQQVKAAMADLPALNNVFRCDCDSDYNSTNTQTKERRYQAVFHIFYKE